MSDVGAEENVILGSYCGTFLPPVIWSASNVLEVGFFSDFSRFAQGFNATYRFDNGISLDYVLCLKIFNMYQYALVR